MGTDRVTPCSFSRLANSPGVKYFVIAVVAIVVSIQTSHRHYNGAAQKAIDPAVSLISLGATRTARTLATRLAEFAFALNHARHERT